ncbi:hypothetical protein BTE28158_04087 [Burkholderia territorii]|nr:hypothetical protein BTE28158_04087 [Burkholderia territorii]
MPTSRYWIICVNDGPLVLGVLELEITGTLSPIMMRAFSLLRARMRGLASRFASVSVSLKSAVADSPLTFSALTGRWCSTPHVSAELGVDTVNEFGQLMPSCDIRSCETSSTSTSSITSGSGKSCAEIISSATLIMSGVPRIVTVFARSSITASFTFNRLFSSDWICFASTFDNWNVRTLSSWYSSSLAGVAG